MGLLPCPRGDPLLFGWDSRGGVNVRQPWCPDDTRRIPLLNYNFGVTSSEATIKLPRNSVVENVVMTLIYCDRFDPRNSVFNRPKKSNAKSGTRNTPLSAPNPQADGWHVLTFWCTLPIWGDVLLQETNPKFHAFRPIFCWEKHLNTQFLGLDFSENLWKFWWIIRDFLNETWPIGASIW